jgi:lysophospholipase L1-like esterase
VAFTTWKHFDGSSPLLPSGLLGPVRLRREVPQGSETVRYQSAIDAFLRADSAAPPPKHAILFIGSSIFRQWTRLKEDMAPLPVFNRAFGGSRTGDLLQHMEKIVLPYEPSVIVYYCGSNDINAGAPADSIAGRFVQFRKRVGDRLPATRFFYVSINRAPQKRARWGTVDSANASVRAFCERDPLCTFIDVNPLLFTPDGEPRLELYQKDQLHFVEQAYEEFTSVIRPVLLNAWKGIPRGP